MHVWDCPTCGERLDDEITYNANQIDSEHDRTERIDLCECGQEVNQRMSNHNGNLIPVMREVDDERMRDFAYGEYYEDDEY